MTEIQRYLAEEAPGAELVRRRERQEVLTM
jgi:hypothetical protein